MIVEFPFFAAGINYFPDEISVLRIFEPRYLLLIGDSIQNNSTFCVGRSLDKLNEVVSEVRIIDHQDTSNAEQVVVVECVNLVDITNINLKNEYPKVGTIHHNSRCDCMVWITCGSFTSCAGIGIYCAIFTFYTSRSS